MSGSGGQVRERKPGQWEGRFYVDGKRRSVYAPTRREAQAKVRKAIEAGEQGIRPTPQRLTVGAWLDEWLETACKPRLRPSTFESYQYVVEGRIKPAIGRIALAKLEPRDVQRMLDGLPERLSSTTRKYTYTVLRNALGRAVKQQLVVRNVATLIDAPTKSRWTMTPLDVEQVQAFLAFLAGDPDNGVPPDRHEALYTLAIATGARQGELLGLRWSDVDLDTGVVQIRRTLYHGRLGDPKSAAGVRDVRLGASALTLLRRHRVAQAEARLRAGRRWVDADHIFTTSTGRPLDARNVTRWLQVTLAAAGLPRQRFHDLRHAYATIALARGVDLAVVSKSLGHAQVSTTADIYLHWVPAMRDAIAETMEAVLAG